MGILAKLLGAGDVIKEGMELIDNLHTSTEEEIAAKSKARTDLLAAYAPFKIAQRVIAIMFTVVFLFCFFLVMFLTMGGVGDLEDVRGVIAEFWIGPIMLTIVGFYFGGGAFEGAFNARKAK